MTRATLMDRVRITAGEHAGRIGVVIAHDPKWLRVRLADGAWPFPTYAWVHRADYAPCDPLADMPDALV